MQRELGSFPLPPVHRYKLNTAGFTTAQDVLEMKPSELSKEFVTVAKVVQNPLMYQLSLISSRPELGLSLEDALSIWRTVKGENEQGEMTKLTVPAAQSALEMLQDEQSLQAIITFSQELDTILGGGVPLTKITELCGAPGIGKTQMCMQLCTDVQIPQAFGGLSGEAVYIDTEGSFLVQRLADIAKATVSHCQDIAVEEQAQEQVAAMKNFTLESLLAGVHYFRCHDYVELIALVHTLPEFLKDHSKVRLVVVDSIAFHFRHDFDDYSLRTRLLNGMAQQFIKMAFKTKLAVVLTNQMTTKFSASRAGTSQLIPALGESWGHAATIRLILYWENQQRRALLYKSPSHKETSVPYQITTGGIRDIYQEGQLQENAAEDDDSHPAKRRCLEQS